MSGMSVPRRSGRCRSASSASRVRRGSTTTSRAPRACAASMRPPMIGVVLGGVRADHQEAVGDVEVGDRVGHRARAERARRGPRPTASGRRARSGRRCWCRARRARASSPRSCPRWWRARSRPRRRRPGRPSCDRGARWPSAAASSASSSGTGTRREPRRTSALVRRSGWARNCAGVPALGAELAARHRMVAPWGGRAHGPAVRLEHDAAADGAERADRLVAIPELDSQASFQRRPARACDRGERRASVLSRGKAPAAVCQRWEGGAVRPCFEFHRRSRRIVRTGQGAQGSTCATVLPSSSAPAAERPCVPIAIMSAALAFACSSTISGGWPSMATVSTVSPAARSARRASRPPRVPPAAWRGSRRRAVPRAARRLVRHPVDVQQDEVAQLAAQQPRALCAARSASAEKSVGTSSRRTARPDRSPPGAP